MTGFEVQRVEAVDAVEAPGSQFEPVIVVRGEVPGAAVAYATDKLIGLESRIAAPLLFARIKLTLAADPAVTRPADVQLTLDVNGDVVRAHVAATTMTEAVDLVEARALDKLTHRAERREWRRRHSAVGPAPIAWAGFRPPVNGSLTVAGDDPVIVRQKSLAAGEMTLEEAAFDMAMLDYGFYLFRDLATGDDAVVSRSEDRGFVLQCRRGRQAEGHSWTIPVDVVTAPAPVLTSSEAVDLLRGADAPFVFFADVDSGRGAIVYRRIDGKFGLVTMA